MHIASLHPDSFLVIDEAEYLLENIDKALLNELMEIKGRRVIWIVNKYHCIHPAVKRRFSYSIYFPKPGAASRRKLWNSILSKHQLTLPNEQIAALTEAYPVTAGVINTAVKNAAILKRPEPYSDVDESIRAYTQLINNGGKVKKYKASADFSPNAICTQSDPSTLLAQVKQLYGLEEPRATMLFYGPPGTGKTALARYIAKRLDKEAIVKRGSDIFGSYVGETEANIARAFAEAEHEGSVLIFDEADSFIYSRDIAQRSWESSFVNEFLTNLEEFKGICICTTNRRDNMDSAAMRRFSFKIPFVYAAKEQIFALYETLLAPLIDSPLTEKCRQALTAMQNLTPGDFHAVKASSRFDPHSSLTHEELIQRLRHETELKLEKGSVIGFNAG